MNTSAPSHEEIIASHFPGETPTSIIGRVITIEVEHNYAVENYLSWREGKEEANIRPASNEDQPAHWVVEKCKFVGKVKSSLYCPRMPSVELITNAPHQGFDFMCNTLLLCSRVTLFLDTSPTIIAHEQLKEDNFLADVPVKLTLR